MKLQNNIKYVGYSKHKKKQFLSNFRRNFYTKCTRKVGKPLNCKLMLWKWDQLQYARSTKFEDYYCDLGNYKRYSSTSNGTLFRTIEEISNTSVDIQKFIKFWKVVCSWLRYFKTNVVALFQNGIITISISCFDYSVSSSI